MRQISKSIVACLVLAVLASSAIAQPPASQQDCDDMRDEMEDKWQDFHDAKTDTNTLANDADTWRAACLLLGATTAQLKYGDDQLVDMQSDLDKADDHEFDGNWHETVGDNHYSLQEWTNCLTEFTGGKADYAAAETDALAAKVHAQNAYDHFYDLYVTLGGP